MWLGEEGLNLLEMVGADGGQLVACNVDDVENAFNQEGIENVFSGEFNYGNGDFNAACGVDAASESVAGRLLLLVLIGWDGWLTMELI